MTPSDDFETFVTKALAWVRHPRERGRAEALIRRWAAQWTGPRRSLTATFSNHGAFLQFNQLIGTTWSHVFVFHAAPRHGLSLRGPDPDRMRKSHRDRDRQLDRSGLDGIFEDWSAFPEARPAGNAVELYLDEAADDVWEAFLQAALTRLP